MSLPTEALVLEPTADGLMTLFSEDFGEWFYNRDGAYAEAKITDVDTTLASSLTVLDVCCGLGYNTAAALAAVTQVNPGCQVRVFALELDRCGGAVASQLAGLSVGR